MKLYQKNASVVYFGQIDNPYDKFLSREFVYPLLRGKNGKILDIGCGAGRNMIEMAKLGFDVVGVDHNSVPLKIAKEYARKHKVQDKIKIVHKDILRMRAGELGLFDYCICQEVIEHIVDYQKVIDFIYSSLKRGGVLILTTQHNPNLWNDLDDYAQHVKRFTKSEITDALY
ncbi:MAG: class I SAM-dependent methyltransferase, partial [Patescibacteria group bacterium]